MGMLTKLAEETAPKPRTRKPKVVPLDAPAPSVVDRVAEQQAAIYADHPDVVSQAKAFAAQRLADAQASEAEARTAMAREMLGRVAAERKAAEVKAQLDARVGLLAQHTALCQMALHIVAKNSFENPEEIKLNLERARVCIALATELRLAQRDS
jgi:hypothetical protein